MKTTLIAGVAVGLLSTGALAADLPMQAAPPAPLVPVFTWSGAYVGVNAGYAGDGYGYPFTITQGGTTITSANRSLTSSGPMGGGQVGYNFAVPNIGLPYEGGLVVGGEADLDAANIGGNTRILGSALTTAGAGSASAGTTTSLFGTTRGRLGLSFGRLLLFGTGGYAYAEARTSVYGKVGTGSFTATNSVSHSGAVFGGGAEYLMTEHLTARIEFLHAELNAQNIAAGVSGAERYVIGERPGYNIVRAGLSYKIDPFSAWSSGWRAF